MSGVSEGLLLPPQYKVTGNMAMVIPSRYFLTLNSGKEITVGCRPTVSGGRCSYGW